MVIWPNSTGMVPGWSPTKIVQMVMIGCISRSRGQNVGFQNAIFKNLLVWNYKAQSFQIWYIASSRSPLPIFGLLVVLCKWIHLDPWPFPQVSDRGHFGPSCFLYTCTFVVMLKHPTPHKYVCVFACLSVCLSVCLVLSCLVLSVSCLLCKGVNSDLVQHRILFCNAIDDGRKELRETIIELQGHSAFNRTRCSDVLTQCNYITCMLVNLNHDTFQNMKLVSLICRMLT